MYRIAWIVIVVGVAGACGEKKDTKPNPKVGSAEKPKDKAKEPDKPEKPANTGGRSLGESTTGSGSAQVAGGRPADDVAPRPKPKQVAGDCTWKIEDVALAAVCEYRCSLDEREACALAAKKLAAGDGVKADPKHALVLATRACELESAQGCAFAGTLAKSSDAAKGAEFETKAKPLLERDCGEGNGLACWQAGVNAIAAGEQAAKTTIKKGVDLMRAACDGGDGTQCSVLATGYNTGGPGVQKDVMFAAELRKKACEHGHATTCFELSKETNKDDKRAALVDKACTLGLRAACAKLALELAGQNTIRSAQVNQRACQLGDLDACIRQGEDHAKRDEKDKAAEMFARACQLGNDRGCAQARALGK